MNTVTMNTIYYHSITLPPSSGYELSGFGVCELTAHVEWDFDSHMFVHKRVNKETGRIHSVYFDTLDDFVKWHYTIVGFDIPNEESLLDEVYTIDSFALKPIQEQPVTLLIPPLSEQSCYLCNSFTPSDIEADLVASHGF